MSEDLEGLIAFLDAASWRRTRRTPARPFVPVARRWSEVGHGERIPEMAHIERHGPDRTLREVAAYRVMLASGLEWLIRTLGVVYSDRPGYRPEWTP